MSAEQRVCEYLITNAGRQYCDDCLSAALQINPRQQVQQKTSNLARRPSFRRAPGVCSSCRSNKVVIEAIGKIALDRPKPQVPIQVPIEIARRTVTVAPTSAKKSTSNNTLELSGALVLVSCVKSKQSGSVPARLLYTSAWFRGVRGLVEASGARWFILSAFYGLVAPDAEIAPYEYTLNSLGVAERRAWAKQVLDKLLPETAGYSRVVMFAGQRYREFLIEPLRQRGISVEIPMEGLVRGQQLA